VGGGGGKTTTKEWEKKITLGVGGVDTNCKGFFFSFFSLFLPLFVVIVGVHFVFLFTLSP